jgi:hypothetical protein
VYTHHVNDVHTGQLFMCYHNIVTSICTCLCWQSADILTETTSASDKIAFLHHGETPGTQHITNGDNLKNGGTVDNTLGAQTTHDFEFGGRP